MTLSRTSEEDGIYTLSLITPTWGGGGLVVRLTVVDESGPSGICPHCGVPVPPGHPTGSCGRDDGLLIGNAAIARMGRDCCGKPQGCANPTDECLYKSHPFKRHLYHP